MPAIARRGTIVAIMVLLFVPLLIGRIGREPAPPELPEPPATSQRLVLAFQDSEPGTEYQHFQTELRGHVDVVSPHWLRFNGEGRLTRRRYDARLASAVRDSGAELWPLVSYAGPYGTPAGCPPALCSSDRRGELTSTLVNWATEHQVDAFVLDVEYLPAAVGPFLLQLVQELQRSLSLSGQDLWVAVFPQVDFPADLAQLHDVAALGAAATGLVLMAYDLHGPRTGPGPVAPLSWVERNVRSLLEKVPAPQILLGVPAYGYIWEHRNSGWRVDVLPAKTAEAQPTIYAAKADAYWEGTTAGRTKALLARELDLAGVAVWRQELASPQFWPDVRDALDGGG